MRLVNILILGPGSIGSLWATKLRLAGHNVSLWARHSHKCLPIKLDQDPEISFANQSISALENADLILVTVKACQVELAIQPLLKHIPPETIVMLMHNGMGTTKFITKKLASNPIVIATTTHGAYKPASNHVLHTGFGTTYMGGFNSQGTQCHFLQAVMDHALPTVHWQVNIQPALWNKLAINCVINPLTAIHQCKNGQLAAPEFQPMINNLIQELVEVMNKEEIEVEFASLHAIIMQVIHATAENYSSMRQDIFHQRDTEIDFITGYVMHCAEQHQIAVPENAKLYRRIKQIEHSWKNNE